MVMRDREYPDWCLVVVVVVRIRNDLPKAEDLDDTATDSVSTTHICFIIANKWRSDTEEESFILLTLLRLIQQQVSANVYELCWDSVIRS